MPRLRFDAEQRFTCQGCARCCKGGWQVLVTPAELEDYRRAKAERFFRAAAEGPEGQAGEPFEPLPNGFAQIRKRDDGACGFLSAQDRCRLHEELGLRRKPLVCRAFPFRFQALGEGRGASASDACPTVVRNQGQTLEAQARELRELERDCARAFPEPPGRLELGPGRTLAPASLETLLAVLQALLERPSPEGRLDLRANVGRMAALLEDLLRLRVVRLPDERFAEYLELVARHAQDSARPAPPRRSTALQRLLFRGFLFAVQAARLQARAPRSGLRLGLRLRLLALLLHLHLPLPAAGGLDRRAARRVLVDLDEPGTRELVHAALRRALSRLGGGRRPLRDELGVGLGLIGAALVLAAQVAAAAGRAVAAPEDVVAGLNAAGELEHADERGLYARLLALLAGGLGALDLFASGRNGVSRPARG